MRAVFCDLNGTLAEPVRDRGARAISPLPNAFKALAGLAASNYICPIITNQGRISRGLFTIEHFHLMCAEFIQQAAFHGARLGPVYVCPHDLGAACSCRKPQTSLFEEAIRRHRIRPEDSWVVGDTGADLVAAHRLGIPAILVRTGHGRAAELDAVPRRHVADDIEGAVDYILSRSHPSGISAPVIPRVDSGRPQDCERGECQVRS